MNEVRWYEKGDVGDMIRDLLDFWDEETCTNGMRQLGLSDEEIAEVFLREEEYA